MDRLVWGGLMEIDGVNGSDDNFDDNDSDDIDFDDNDDDGCGMDKKQLVWNDSMVSWSRKRERSEKFLLMIVDKNFELFGWPTYYHQPKVH